MTAWLLLAAWRGAGNRRSCVGRTRVCVAYIDLVGVSIDLVGWGGAVDSRTATAERFWTRSTELSSGALPSREASCFLLAPGTSCLGAGRAGTGSEGRPAPSGQGTPQRP